MSLHLKNLIDVTRLSKPIGFLLLFWPCAWGLSLAHYFQRDINTFFSHLVLFFFGSVLMRSAGGIVNDIVDEKIDKKVFRTKKRPIASGSLSKELAWTYVLILCALAFLVLIQFNFLTICLGIFSMIFAFSYPFMKRFTYWPQLFLGFTFNWGIIMAWTSITNEISYLPILLYFGAIFWTIGYDTIYGIQDISDDEVIGVKSTAIKFKDSIGLFVGSCYLISSASIVIVMANLKIDTPSECIVKFKSNNYLGIVVFINILIGKIL